MIVLIKTINSDFDMKDTNVHLVKTVSRHFIGVEKGYVLGDITGYTNEFFAYVRTPPVRQTIRKCLFVLHRQHGKGALLGFASIMTLMKRWQEEQAKPSWLALQCDTIELSTPNAMEYIIPFLDLPNIGITQVAEVLGPTSAVGDFIAYFDERHPTFGIGAFFAVGLLFLNDNARTDEITIRE